ncbi:alpha-ribazole phosphatase [hot springs metagenome]|uniref:Alpha-ribazole phosphatase n=1 Tax=hot springs metagenome TaxID=433727 RepID=A0A5J4L3J4_9ZZZZ
MVKTLYLIRHGETVGGDEKRYKGSIDVPLSEKGIEQIKKTAKFLSSIPLSAIYTSPLSRALKSAEIIAEGHGLNPIIIPELRERSFGIWEGMTFLEIKEKYPVEFENWVNNPLKYSPPQGESTIQVRDRVIKALDEILNKSHHASRITHHGLLSELQTNIVIVAHGGVNRVILCHVMGIPLENIFRIEQDNSAINIIEFWDKYPVLHPKKSNDFLGTPVVRLLNGRWG